MTLILNAAITTAGSFFGQPFTLLDPRQRFTPQHHNIEALFTYGSGGTSIDVYLQVSHDGGANWKDVAHFAQLTTSSTRSIWRTNSTDSVVDADVQQPAPFARWRTRHVVVGAYSNMTLQVNVINASLVAAGVGP